MQYLQYQLNINLFNFNILTSLQYKYNILYFNPLSLQLYQTKLKIQFSTEELLERIVKSRK